MAAPRARPAPLTKHQMGVGVFGLGVVGAASVRRPTSTTNAEVVAAPVGPAPTSATPTVHQFMRKSQAHREVSSTTAAGKRFFAANAEVASIAPVTVSSPASAVSGDGLTRDGLGSHGDMWAVATPSGSSAPMLVRSVTSSAALNGSASKREGEASAALHRSNSFKLPRSPASNARGVALAALPLCPARRPDKPLLVEESALPQGGKGRRGNASFWGKVRTVITTVGAFRDTKPSAESDARKRGRELWVRVGDVVRQRVRGQIMLKAFLDVRSDALAQLHASDDVSPGATPTGDGSAQATEGYHQQGDEEMYTLANMLKRENLRTHPAVTGITNRFWRVAARPGAPTIDEADYTRLFTCVLRVVAPEMDEEEATAAIRRDWEADSGGQQYLDPAGLHNALFELADTWCAGVEWKEYSEFLSLLYDSLVVKGTGHGASGERVDMLRAPGDITSPFTRNDDGSGDSDGEGARKRGDGDGDGDAHDPLGATRAPAEKRASSPRAPNVTSPFSASSAQSPEFGSRFNERRRSSALEGLLRFQEALKAGELVELEAKATRKGMRAKVVVRPPSPKPVWDPVLASTLKLAMPLTEPDNAYYDASLKERAAREEHRFNALVAVATGKTRGYVAPEAPPKKRRSGRRPARRPASARATRAARRDTPGGGREEAHGTAAGVSNREPQSRRPGRSSGGAPPAAAHDQATTAVSAMQPTAGAAARNGAGGDTGLSISLPVAPDAVSELGSTKSGAALHTPASQPSSAYSSAYPVTAQDSAELVARAQKYVTGGAAAAAPSSNARSVDAEGGVASNGGVSGAQRHRNAAAARDTPSTAPRRVVDGRNGSDRRGGGGAGAAQLLSRQRRAMRAPVARLRTRFRGGRIEGMVSTPLGIGARPRSARAAREGRPIGDRLHLLQPRSRRNADKRPSTVHSGAAAFAGAPQLVTTMAETSASSTVEQLSSIARSSLPVADDSEGQPCPGISPRSKREAQVERGRDVAQLMLTQLSITTRRSAPAQEQGAKVRHSNHRLTQSAPLRGAPYVPA